jgi:hypothetical protein
MKQIQRKSQQGLQTLPRRVRRTWHCRSHAVDFLRNKGGPYGVKLILDTANAKKLSTALKACAKLAKEARKNRVEIDAHWGKSSRTKGYPLDVRVRP